MSSFRYIASVDGSRREGVIQSDSMHDAAAALRGQGMMVLSLQEAPEAAAEASASGHGFRPDFFGSLFIRKADVETMLGQLGSLISGGVPIVAALNALAGQMPKHLGKVLRAIAARVRGGCPLSKSAREEAAFLGETTLGLIEAGEANGTVSEMIQESTQLMARVREIKSQMVQAFSYPAIVTLGAIGVAAYMVRVVFPTVLKFIEGQRSDVRLPAVSRALIAVSEFMTEYGLYVLLAPWALLIAIQLVRRTEQGGKIIDRALLALPLVGKALRAASNAMWTRILGTLVRSGIDIVTAIDLAERTLKNTHYRSQFRKVRRIVRHGRSLSEAIRSTDLERLCPLAPVLISVGEQAGGVDDGLLQIAVHSEGILDQRTKLLAKLVEPAVFLVVGGMVGFVYFGFFLAVLAATRSAG
jgi:type IV pilus assembly protein PilC